MISNYGYPYFPSPQSKKTLIDSCQFSKQHPEWTFAAKAASQCIGSVQINGIHMGNALFIGEGKMLAPLHVIQEAQNLSQIKICFAPEDENICFVPQQIAVHGIMQTFSEDDLCVIATDKENLSRSPSFHYGSSSECLFVQMNAKGQIAMSLVNTCLPNFWDSGFCSYAPTLPGSSGGCYFDKSGALVAMHLARSTGRCGFDSGRERKGITATEIAKRIGPPLHNDPFYSMHSFSLSPVKPVPLSMAIPKIQNTSVCYINEGGGKGKKVVEGQITGYGYTCEYKEIRNGNGKHRSIRIVTRHKNLPRGIVSKYKLTTCENFNPHVTGSAYNKHQEQFYQEAAVAFLNKYCNHGTIAPQNCLIPQDFRFDNENFQANIDKDWQR